MSKLGFSVVGSVLESNNSGYRGIGNSWRSRTYRITTVRLNVEENQLVNVFGEFCVCVGSLKSA
jgi:hypothetical protein